VIRRRALKEQPETQRALDALEQAEVETREIQQRVKLLLEVIERTRNGEDHDGR
jgi:hypothetical protein